MQNERPKRRHRFCLMRLLPLAVLLFLIGWSAPSAKGQDFERFAPRTPPAGREGGIREEDDTPPAVEDHTELIAALKGLVFVPKPDDVQPSGRPEIVGVRVEGVELMDQAEWSERLAPRFGAPLSMAGLNEIMAEVIRYYRDEGRPVVDVVVLEQDITAGVVQLAVVEARLGEVRAEGARYFKAERLAGQVRLRTGGPIYSSILRADLAWLNNNPFRSVDLVYSPGLAEGETDVILRVDDRFPMRVYAGYEDSGNELTGDHRWLAGINYGNLWGLDHQINYQWTLSSELDLLSAHAVSYVAPLPWRHTATVFAAHVDSEADLPAPFNLSGETTQVGTRYTVPLPAPNSATGGFSHEIELGFDFKNSTSNLEFGLTPLPGVDTDIAQFVMGYRMSSRDALGASGLGVFGFASPGEMTHRNDDLAFSAARAGAEASYFYVRIDAERLHRLPGGWTAMLKGTGQLADGNLLPSEQLGLGGYSSVRGYEEREANVDRGYLVSAELRTPPVSLRQIFKLPGGGADEFQFLFFIDHAYGRSVDRLPGEARDISLTSIGPGCRWALGDRCSMRFDYGFQLEDSGMALSQGDSRAHLGVVVAY